VRVRTERGRRHAPPIESDVLLPLRSTERLTEVSRWRAIRGDEGGGPGVDHWRRRFSTWRSAPPVRGGRPRPKSSLDVWGPDIVGAAAEGARVGPEVEPTVPQVARAYGLEVIDYARAGTGLLISVGAGLMMASMDLATSCRWSIDLRVTDISRLGDALGALEVLCDPVIFVAWFSVTDPADALALRDAHPGVRCYFRGRGSDTGESWLSVVAG
jgi:hypothetical protein